MSREIKKTDRFVYERSFKVCMDYINIEIGIMSLEKGWLIVL